jgi:hypothetical protein
MLEQLWDSFVMLIPVFFLLTMIFGAGFYIGRVSKNQYSRVPGLIKTTK